MQLLLENVGYSYNGVDVVLQDVNFSFEEGKIYAIVGKSGAGKTTLLSLLSQLTKPTTGKIIYNKKDIKEVDQYEYRSKYVGVVFQNFNLLPNLSAVENVMLSMDIAGIKRTDRKEYAMELLRKVGLEDDEANRRILKLSGGQQQRVAIARALSYEPEIILADEPTGNLDEDTQNEIMNIFKQLAYE
ncbi:MAG: ATP-binding cassette domain-containing protein, partial [Longicatena sp.]